MPRKNTSKNDGGKPTPVRVFKASDIEKIHSAKDSLNPRDVIILRDSGEVQTAHEKRRFARTGAKEKAPKVKSERIKRKDQSEEEKSAPTFKYNWLIILFIVLTFGGIMAALYFSTTELVVAYIISILAAIVTFAFAVLFFALRRRTELKTKLVQAGKVKEAEKVSPLRWKNISQEDLQSGFLTILAAGLITTMIILAYIYALDTIIIAWACIAIAEARIAIAMIMKLTKVANKRAEYKGFSAAFYVTQYSIFAVLILITVHLFLGNDLFAPLALPHLNSWNLQFNIAMILVALSGIVGIMQTRLKVKDMSDPEGTYRYKAEGNHLDFDLTGVIRYIVMLILPFITMSIYPISGAIMSASIAPAQVAGYNYFNGIYLSIVLSRYTQFSMVIIVLSSLSIIIGKARGQAGTATMVIGALGMAGVPMIICIMAFIGQVPAPEEFYELFGAGFGNLIFAISYTSVIALALSLVGVFYEMVPSISAGTFDD